MPRIVVLDQVLKSWLFRFLTTKVDVLFIRQKPNRFLFQFRFERAIACFFWRSYNLLRDSAGSNTPQAALPTDPIERFVARIPRRCRRFLLVCGCLRREGGFSGPFLKSVYAP